MESANWLKEFPGAITICDTLGIILSMNDQAAAGFVQLSLEIPDRMPHFVREG